MTGAIVGREVELAAVERFLDTLTREPAVLVVEGEAGIGKTTVWIEACRLAVERGLRVLQARPTQSEARLSYAALADLVGAVYDEVSAMLPDVQRRALGAALLRTDAGGDARTVATALTGSLGELASQGPVLVAIDDVQWIDPASGEAIGFAARRLPAKVGLLVTRRTQGGEELPLGLGRLLPEGCVQRLEPSPLSLAGLHHLVKERTGSSFSRPLLTRLADASGGNPFFALEIARALEPGDRAAAGPLPVPGTLEELAGGRAASLSPAARAVVLAASALSQPTAATIAAALGDDVGPGLVEAEEAGVLVSEPDGVRFTHPLHASAAYSAASPERRRQLHGRLAAVVADPEERARHLALSTTEPDETVAAELEAAARSAARRGAQRAAAELFEASRRLTPAGRDEDTGRRQLGGAAALLAAGDVTGSTALAEQAASSPVTAQRAEAEFLLGEALWVAGTFQVATAHYIEALATAPDDAALAARVYPKLVYVNVAHSPARALELAETAMDALDGERAPGALASVLVSRYWAGALLGEEPRAELLERWRKLEARAGPEAPMSVLPLILYHSVDDFDAARDRFALEDEWYRLRGEDGWRAERQAHLSYAELRAGNFDQAERLAEESCAQLVHVEQPGPWTMAFRLRSMVDAVRGRTGRARETLIPLIQEARSEGRDWWEALMLSALAVNEFVDGEHRAVDDALLRMHECCAAIGTVDMLPDRSEPFHVESLVVLGEVERARSVLEQLEQRGARFPRLWITVTLPRARALVLAGQGDVEAALAKLDELDLDLAAQLPHDLGWTLLVRGRLERRARRRRAAADSLGGAISIFEQLGAPAWLRQARAELDRVGLRRAPTELTATERRVAELAASGLTTREVAAAAFLSPKTVEANLARVYRKLGIRSRAELGARMEGQREPQM